MERIATGADVYEFDDDDDESTNDESTNDNDDDDDEARYGQTTNVVRYHWHAISETFRSYRYESYARTK